MSDWRGTDSSDRRGTGCTALTARHWLHSTGQTHTNSSLSTISSVLDGRGRGAREGGAVSRAGAPRRRCTPPTPPLHTRGSAPMGQAAMQAVGQHGPCAAHGSPPPPCPSAHPAAREAHTPSGVGSARPPFPTPTKTRTTPPFGGACGRRQDPGLPPPDGPRPVGRRRRARRSGRRLSAGRSGGRRIV